MAPIRGLQSDPINILLVDDLATNLLSLEAILERPGYNLVRATSGAEALALLEQESFAVVLLDVMMPGMDGFEVARRAKAMDSCLDTPLIFVTAVASESGYVTKGYAFGAADYLTKPLDPDEVRAKVAVFVDLYRKNQRLLATERRLRALNEELEQRAEAKARELAVSNERFRLFVEGVREYGFIQMDEQGRFITWNAGAERLLGYSETEIIGLPFSSIFTPEDAAAGVPEHELATARAHGRADDTRWHQRRDGSRFWAHGITTALVDDHGCIRGFAKVLRDYTDQKRAEEALLASEAQLRLVTDSLPALVCYLDRDQCHRFANQSYREWLGRDPAAVQGRHVRDVFGDGAYARIGASVEDALRGRHSEFELDLPLPDGGSRTVHGTFTPDVAGRGEVRGVVGLLHDVTARKQAENALRESQDALRERQQWFESLLDLMPVAVVIVELGTGAVISTNRAAHVLTGDGYPEALPPLGDTEHYMTDGAGRLMPRHDWPRFRTARGEHLRDLEVTWHWPGGSRALLVTSTILPPMFGKPGRGVIVFQDITARKDAEGALAESREVLAHIQRAAGVAGWVRTLETDEVAWSGAIEEVYGRRPTPSDDFCAFILPEDRPLVEGAIRRAIDDHEDFHADFRIRRADGGVHWLTGRGKVVRDAKGGPIRMFGINMDITERKRSEEALRRARAAAEAASHAKSQFLANMSHEIRTPLNAIVGFAALLDELDLPEEERREFGATIRRNGRLLSQIIDDILDLSKVEAGKLTIEKVPCHLPSILRDVTSLLEPQAQEKGIRLSVRAADDEVPERITTDPIRLKQILINIVGNAVKFTSRGRVEIDVRRGRTGGTDGRPTLTFTVTDTGRGISPGQAEQLFQPFMQADASTTRTYGGTGLGLALSRRLAQALGGSIELTASELGRGSTFTITVEVGPTEGWTIIGPAAAHGELARSLKDERALSGIRILVAEDSADSRNLIDRILTGGGAEVELACDGAEAVEKALAHDPDVVLMDLQMPRLDGIDATSLLRRRGYAKPIIALTAHAMKEERERCLRSGATDHIGKPVHIAELVEKITGHVRDQGR